MPPWVAKEKMGTLLLASEMPVPIPRYSTVVVLRGRLPVSGVGSIGIVPIVKRERGGECSTVYSLPLSKWKSPHLINSSVRLSVLHTFSLV